MDKRKSLLEDLTQATTRLEEALQEPFSQLIQDATIQRFEFTFELAWKLLKTVLADQGIETNSPKQTIREAGKEGLVDDIEAWISFTNARNLTAHTYREELAKEVYQKAKEFTRYLHSLINKLS